MRVERRFVEECIYKKVEGVYALSVDFEKVATSGFEVMRWLEYNWNSSSFFLCSVKQRTIPIQRCKHFAHCKYIEWLPRGCEARLAKNTKNVHSVSSTDFRKSRFSSIISLLTHFFLNILQQSFTSLITPYPRKLVKSCNYLLA